MRKNEAVGHLAVRIPIFLVEERESGEMPEACTFLAAGPAELASHDIPVAWHGHLREELEESGGFESGGCGPAEPAGKTTQ